MGNEKWGGGRRVNAGRGAIAQRLARLRLSMATPRQGGREEEIERKEEGMGVGGMAGEIEGGRRGRGGREREGNEGEGGGERGMEGRRKNEGG